MPFTPGTQVGPYRIMEQLGQGGMATVYKAYHASLDRYVAIKVLHRAFLEDPNFLARFQREARVVARLEHPNIVPIYDYAEYEGLSDGSPESSKQPYLVMKYIEGDTLKARLQAGPLTPGEVEHIVDSVGAALSYAHRQGILHRDIKPSNVLLANDGQIYLADFGLARIAQSGESTLTSDMVIGTPQYISPEQAMSKKELDEGTDIYSFGVMLYEMTVGRVPFSADTPFSVIHDHIYSPLPLPSAVNPGVSPALERVLLKALSKERADRYKDVASMVAAFKEAWTTSASTLAAPAAAPVPEPAAAASSTASAPLTLPGVPTAQTPPPAVPPAVTQAQKPKSRSRWMWVAAVLLLCLCCVAVLAVWQITRKKPAAPATHNMTATAPATINAPPPLTPAAGEFLDLSQVNLDQAQQQVNKTPRDARAHLVYGFALVRAGRKKDGYDQIKQGALAARNQMLLIGAAKAFEEQKAWLAAAIVYVQMYQNTGTMLPVRPEAIHQAIYHGFEEIDAPQVLDYGTIAQMDQALALIAQARYTIMNGNQDAQAMIDKLEAIQPGLGERKLLQAQLWVAQNRQADAKNMLQSLIDAPNIPAWIKDEATTILSGIK
ncbi:MAG: protein kinase [Anaerolineales bacterium]